VGEILASLGLDDRADQRVSTFSGGMQRRLNLGAALVHRPRLLLLDEPTAGVDPQSRHRLFEEIRRLNEAGLTIIYTSHYMEEVQALCTRIGIIDHGKLIACGTLPNLLQRLPARIRFRAAAVNDALLAELKDWNGSALQTGTDGTFELECAGVPAVLTRLLTTLQRHHVELTELETMAPNLERVFLHLTGHALRD
jgi:ABC-2 type transport system ATP-binding protein